jgi:DNA helicase-2/ATP-dependent DNA helicase PcrA
MVLWKSNKGILWRIVMEFTPSIYQQAIFNEIESGSDNVVIDAVPGSGKTETIIKGISHVPDGLSVCVIAYNKHIVEAGRKKLPIRTPQARMYSFHQIGLQAISRSFFCPSGKYPEVDDNKLYNILSELFKTKYMDLKQNEVTTYKSAAKKLVSLHKNLLISEVKEETILQLMEKYSITSEEELNTKRLTDIVTDVLYQCKIQIATIDYDDMIWYPVVYNLQIPYRYDILFVDESQDLNNCQMILLMKALKPNGRVIAVGDSNQSIYAFRGADHHAIPNLIKMLNAKVMPLSITYRCPKKHVEILKKFVPHIEAAPWAIEGEILDIPESKLAENIKVGDVIICRYTAPLITAAFKLLKTGLKVAIKGRDIGEGLIAVIDDLKAANIDEFYIKLKEWRVDKQKKVIQAGKNPEQIHDKYECLVALAENCDNIWCLKEKIYTIFDDGNAAVVLATIHRFKGEEARRVHILHPELMPSCYARTPDDFVQEVNAQYIAYSRSLETIFQVR